MRKCLIGIVIAALTLMGCSSGGGDSGTATTATTTGAAGSGAGSSVYPVELSPLRVEAGDAARFVDDGGRQVLLRGVNVNALGDYHRADPDLAPTVGLKDADWTQMASLGFNVVRLVLSWSLLEPERGALDADYVARIHRAVEAASSNGIYVVLDMHQDAWAKDVATPEGVQCPEGLERAIGWDGAPKWATFTDDADTCRVPGARETAPAVRAAFGAFYDNRSGIRDALARTWGRLAAEFADEPAVAGYDLFNEPNAVEALDAQLPKYMAFVGDSIHAIRAGEQAAGGFDHIVFVEPVQVYPAPNTAPPAGFNDDPNLAFSPHLYFESISDVLTIEQGFAVSEATSAELGVPYWVGEYGWWSTDPADLAELARYAAAEDEALVGGAWWQWRQACGDPHSIGVPGRQPEDQYHLHTLRCPSGEDRGITEPYAVVLSRAYPRSAPGRLRELRVDPGARTAVIRGDTDSAGGELVVWIPDGGHGKPELTGTNISEVELDSVAGGWIASTKVSCAYSLGVDVIPPSASGAGGGCAP